MLLMHLNLVKRLCWRTIVHAGGFLLVAPTDERGRDCTFNLSQIRSLMSAKTYRSIGTLVRATEHDVCCGRTRALKHVAGLSRQAEGWDKVNNLVSRLSVSFTDVPVRREQRSVHDDQAERTDTHAQSARWRMRSLLHTLQIGV